MQRSTLRTVTLTVLALAVLCPTASATWSILIVDTATGEIAIGIATCLVGFDLRPSTVVVVPGVGVAAAQSFVGPLSLRELIRAQLIAGTPPSQILTMLSGTDPGHQSRQYGIAAVAGGTVTFTGTGAGAFASGVTGQVGSLVYTVQGNVLTGMPVIAMAEQAILSTPGDVGQKLMAAMEAARSMGGDGRCSCSQFNPTACGAPPPNFTKAAHIGLVIVSRPGDLDAPCTGQLGCGAGNYYLDLNVANQPAGAPDPVFQLQNMYNAWRAQQAGRPDHFQSTVALSGTQLPGNGATVSGTVVLRDLTGTQLTSSPAVTVSLDPSSTATDVQIGPVTPLGNGTYSFVVTAGIVPGQVVLNVVADDGLGNPVRISPQPVLDMPDPFGPCGAGTVDDGVGGSADVLRIAGTAGTNRVVTVGFGQPFTLEVDVPPLQIPGAGLVGNHLLWVRVGVPTVAESLPLGANIGSLCFPVPPLPFTSPTFLITDTFSGTGLFPAMPAPWATTVAGLLTVADLSVQGVIVEDLPLQLAVTNAIRLRVILMAPPVIVSVAPQSAMVGALVTVTGTGFQPGVAVDLAGMAITPLSVTATEITFTMPAGILCDASLTITNVDAQSTSAIMNPTPVITNALFAAGTSAGGALFLVQGTGLGNATVTIGGNPVTNIISQSGVFITMSTPPGSPGPAIVVVTTPAGCQTTTTYTYL